MHILGTHHVAVICADYARSRRFYAEVLGLAVVSEVHRAARGSYKLDVRPADGTQVELFSFRPRRRGRASPGRVACGTWRSRPTTSTRRSRTWRCAASPPSRSASTR